MTRPPTPRQLLAHIFPILLAGCLLGVFSQTGCHWLLAWAVGSDSRPSAPNQSEPQDPPNQSLAPRLPPTPPPPPPHNCCGGTWCYCSDGKSACCCACGARC